MLFDICDQCCWQRCVAPIEIRVDVLALCIQFFQCVVFDVFLQRAVNEASFWVTLQTTMCTFLCVWLWGAQFVLHVSVEVRLALGVFEGEERNVIVRFL